MSIAPPVLSGRRSAAPFDAPCHDRRAGDRVDISVSQEDGNGGRSSRADGSSTVARGDRDKPAVALRVMVGNRRRYSRRRAASRIINEVDGQPIACRLDADVLHDVANGWVRDFSRLESGKVSQRQEREGRGSVLHVPRATLSQIVCNLRSVRARPDDISGLADADVVERTRHLTQTSGTARTPPLDPGLRTPRRRRHPSDRQQYAGNVPRCEPQRARQRLMSGRCSNAERYRDSLERTRSAWGRAREAGAANRRPRQIPRSQRVVLCR